MNTCIALYVHTFSAHLQAELLDQGRPDIEKLAEFLNSERGWRAARVFYMISRLLPDFSSPDSHYIELPRPPSTTVYHTMLKRHRAQTSRPHIPHTRSTLRTRSGPEPSNTVFSWMTRLARSGTEARPADLGVYFKDLHLYDDLKLMPNARWGDQKCEMYE